MNYKNYKEHIKKKFFKYIPDFILPKFKPSIVQEIIKDDVVIGRVIGINLKELNLLENSQCQQFIEGIEMIKEQGDTSIYIEDVECFPKEMLSQIEQSTGLKFQPGNDIRISNLSSLINEIYRGLGRDINSADTLIICNDRNIIFKIIEELRDVINFFTVYGIDPKDKDEFYEEVFFDTGISIFQPNNMSRIIKNYGTIINFNNEIDLEVFDFRNHSVIIDFSDYKPLKLLKNKKSDILYIQDINFKLDIDSKWISEYVNPELFATIGGLDCKFKQICTNDNYYYINEYINKTIIKKGRI